MKRIFTATLLLTFCFSLKAFAQPLSGAYTIPSPAYANLDAIVTALNANGISANVTVNVTANQTAPAGGYVLGSTLLNANTALGRSIYFKGKATAPAGGLNITANSGTGNHDAIFTIQGTDNVTIDSFNFMESAGNTTATSMMEHGISIVKLNNNDGCKTVSVLNCKITLNNTNSTAQTGISHLGAAGIFVGNCSYTSTAALSTGSEAGTHDGIFIFQDTIRNVNQGVFFSGNIVTADGSAFNDKNGTIQSNLIERFTHDGIYLAYFNNDFLRGNKINNTASGGTAPTGNMLFGIRYNNNGTLQTNTSWNCANNNIELTINSAGTYAATGIMTQVYGTGTTLITEDTIKLTSSGSSAQLNGIFSQNNLGTQNISRNVLTGFSTQTTNIQSVIGIFAGGYSTFPSLGLSNLNAFPTSATVDKNLIDNFSITSGGTAQAVPNRSVGILFDNFTTNPLNINDNTISNISLNNSCVRFIGVGSIWSYGSFLATPVLHTTNFTGNIIENISVSGTNNATPIFCVIPLGTYGNGHTFNSSKNKIRNISSDLGLIAAYVSDYCLNYVLDKDTISSLSSKNWHAIGLINGFSAPAAGAIYSSKNITVKNCSFTSLRSSSVGGGAFCSAIQIQQGTVVGAQYPDVVINNNLIRQIVSDDPAGSALGINCLAGSGSFNINNNMISDVANAPNTTAYSSSFGMVLNAGTNNIYYNTINLAPTAATGYGATGILYNSGGTNKLQNNIIRVDVTAGTANNVAAMRGSAGAATAAPSLTAFNAASNIYYTPKSANNYLYVEGTTNATLVNGYHTGSLTPSTTKNITNDPFFNSECNKSLYHQFMQSAAASREKNTFTENNLTGTGGVFAPSGMSFAESAAQDVPVLIDFSLAARPFSASDIGALEFSGTLRPQMVITITSSTGFDTACPLNLPQLNVSIPSYFNRVSYQWYRDAIVIPGATTTTILVSPFSAIYTVKVYDSATGCEYTSDPFRMTVVPPPPALITYYDSLVFCQGGAVVLQANKGSKYTYQWKRNGINLPSETKDHYVAETSGDYTVEVNTPLGCPSVSTFIRVKVYPLPTPVVYWVRPRVLGVTQKYYTYQWYKNNVKIDDTDALGPLYYVPDDGDGAYTVEVTDSNGCTAKSDVFLFSVGIKDQVTASAIKIYPNPVTDVLYIKSPVAVDIRLSDLTGRIVLSREDAKSVSLADLAGGTYLLTLTDKEGNLVKVEKINKLK